MSESIVTARESPPSVEELIAELYALGLHFVIGEKPLHTTQRLPPEDLLAGLARQTDARLRMALTALFLYRPTLVSAIPGALARLKEIHQTNLKLFYTAAAILQFVYVERLQAHLPLWQPLPDLFSQELNIPQRGDPHERLRHLSARHYEISGLAVNWVGTYQYAATRLITRLEKEEAWAA
ncbi:MAG: hypothetical protein AB1345_12670 [Chloroflexota bacterium]